MNGRGDHRSRSQSCRIGNRSDLRHSDPQLFIFAGSAVVMAFIAERMWAAAADMWEADFRSQFLEVSPSPAVYVLSVLAAINAAILVGMAWRHYKKHFV